MSTEDIEIRRSGEYHVAHVEGQTEDGVEFIDSFVSSSGLVVVDSGRIILSSIVAEAFKQEAMAAGLGIVDGEPLL